MAYSRTEEEYDQQSKKGTQKSSREESHETGVKRGYRGIIKSPESVDSEDYRKIENKSLQYKNKIPVLNKNQLDEKSKY